VYAAPDQQAHPATLPQHRHPALHDAQAEDLLQGVGLTGI